MIAWASRLAMAVARFSRLLSGVGVIAMPNVGLDIRRRVQVPVGAGVLRLLVTGMAVGVFITCGGVADGVEVTL
jgi:hypothetical protein